MTCRIRPEFAQGPVAATVISLRNCIAWKWETLKIHKTSTKLPYGGGKVGVCDDLLNNDLFQMYNKTKESGRK